MQALVVGSGFGALASALRLRALGIDVEVLEACADPGGRARTLSFHGEPFDAGPTVITAPWLFDELFALFGERREDAIEFLPCDPWYRLEYADGSRLDLVSGVERQRENIERLSPSDAAQYGAYLRHSEELYRVGYEQLGDADFSSFSSMLRALPHLLRLGAFRSLWSHTARFFQDRRVRQAFSLQPLLVGGNPLTTTSIYGLIHAMERKGGIWFARGGTGALVRALVSLAQRHGVRFSFSSKVTGVETDSSGAVSSVNVVGAGRPRTVPCDLCVWGGDPVGAYGLLGKARLSLTERLRLRTIEPSMGLYVLYFKSTKPYPDVAHHTIVLSRRWEELLGEIFRGKRLPPDPSLYLHRPASTDPGFSREGGDLFYVLAPVPHLGNFSNWAEQENRFKGVVLKALGERVLPGIERSIDFAESIDPRYFREVLSSHVGAGFSISPLLRQSAWFRFHNKADRVPNLYLCGAGVHPGGGLPGVVTSAKVVERLVRRDFGLAAPDRARLGSVEAKVA